LSFALKKQPDNGGIIPGKSEAFIAVVDPTSGPDFALHPARPAGLPMVRRFAGWWLARAAALAFLLPLTRPL